MTPAQLTAALTLPLTWRRRLARQEGPGCWAIPGRTYGGRNDEAPGLHWHPDDRGSGDIGFFLSRGWAWLPASPLAWLEATGREWEIARGPDGLRTTIYIPPTGAPDDGGDIVRGADPIDCAITYMETHPCPST